MQKLKVVELKPHPRNNEFFDDMTGDKWEEFLKSIETSGVIEPVIITQDKVIVSGHQRIRACKELGITEVMTEMRSYDSEDKVIKDLLETNIRQRGEIGGSTVKLGRRIRELERIYGIQQGNNQYQEDSTIGGKRTQEDLLKQLGIDKESYRRAKSLTTLPPEIQDLVEQGSISPSTASRLIAKLTPEQQEELVKSLPVTEKLTQKKIQGYVDQIKSQETEVRKIKAENHSMSKVIEELKAQEIKPDPTVIIKEVIPEDYESIKADNKNYRSEYDKLNKEYALAVQEKNKYKEQIEKAQEQTPQEQFDKKLRDQTIFFCSHVADFLQRNGGYIWIAEHIKELPDKEKKSYLSAIDSVGAWYQNVRQAILESGDIYE